MTTLVEAEGIFDTKNKPVPGKEQFWVSIAFICDPWIAKAEVEEEAIEDSVLDNLVKKGTKTENGTNADPTAEEANPEERKEEEKKEEEIKVETEIREDDLTLPADFHVKLKVRPFEMCQI